MEKQTKIVERLIIISAVVISIAVISSSLLTQKHGTILVVVPIIIGAVVAMAINIVYWLARSPPRSKERGFRAR